MREKGEVEKGRRKDRGGDNGQGKCMEGKKERGGPPMSVVR